MNQSFSDLAVIDFETTGFRSNTDRVVEIGIVFVNRATMEIVEEWDTLINPMRDVGPTQIHGITASMVEVAPTFNEIAGYLCEKLHGHTLVSHNLPFDKRFLNLELNRLSISHEFGQGYCTLKATGRKLAEACSAIGYSIDSSHHALADARAATALLNATTEKLSDDIVPFQVFDSTLEVNSRTSRRNMEFATNKSSVNRIITNARTDITNSTHSQYLYLLDYVLIDQRIDPDEEEELSKLCRELGICQEERNYLNTKYVESVVVAAKRDNVITVAEYELIRHLSESLKVDVEAPEITAVQTSSPQVKVGTKVCFTGEAMVNGEHYTRSRLTKLAEERGMTVVGGVTKKCDVLVASDAATQSNKAKKARDYGIPILNISEFLENST